MQIKLVVCSECKVRRTISTLTIHQLIIIKKMAILPPLFQFSSLQ
ncbi:Protein of unknown function [Lactobacillus helveticus CIRM-BIA 101]|uniref:Uncharacterized protein n=2 Tax=Lactobacillus helveticus TaxID=1587 RepID=U4QF07_LACHE|nr:Protein of unknown function [Lactobacillus helveticus CIRM-BIA 953]CDI60397.1 Protein of unknown function [Lactobacillus helveticus CIRM-BIA 104]CDI64734.1 Protein of unknown function [Lactobacillus helveticus CIRM-BIA 101]